MLASPPPRAPKGPRLYNAAIMEPRIQYAKTTDGVNIAYATGGEGRTVVLVPSPPISHVQRWPELNRGLFGELTERFHAIW